MTAGGDWAVMAALAALTAVGLSGRSGFGASAGSVFVQAIAAALVYFALSSELHMGRLTALAAGLAYVFHPLCTSIARESRSDVASLAVMVIPLAWLLGIRAGRDRTPGCSMIVGSLAGLLMVWNRAAGSILVLASGLVVVSQSFDALRTTDPASSARPLLRRLLLILFVWLATWGLAESILGGLQAEGSGATNGFHSAPCNSPLAWVDGHGLFAPILHTLSDELRPEADAWYLGWSLLFLTGAGLCVWGRDQAAVRPVAIVVAVGMAGFWLLSGSHSSHAQLRATFEFVLVKHRFPDGAQHVLGLLALSLALVLFVVWSAAARSFSGRHALRFGGVMLASALTLLWWSTSPSFAGELARSAQVEAGPLLRPLAAYGLVAGAAFGLSRLTAKTSHGATAAAIWIAFVLATALDLGLHPRPRHTSPDTRPARQAATALPRWIEKGSAPKLFVQYAPYQDAWRDTPFSSHRLF